MDRPLCEVCNKRKAMRRKTANGEFYYAKRCGTCFRTPEGIEKKKQRAKEHYANGYVPPKNRIKAQVKKSYCEKCGFVAEHPCQLDVDHIDGNNRNNDPTNLMTLCANCHRLKTMQCGDNRRRYPVEKPLTEADPVM